jgi:dihydroflavonol-4-reductase
MITVDGVRLSRYRMYFSSDKARQRLGYRPRAADKALADAVAWFQAEAVVNSADALSLHPE